MIVGSKAMCGRMGGLEGASCKRREAFIKDKEELTKESRPKRQG